MSGHRAGGRDISGHRAGRREVGAGSDIAPRGEAEVGEGGWRRADGRGPWVAGVKSLAVVVAAGAGIVRLLTGRDWPFWGIAAACAGAAVLIVAAAVAYDLLRLRATRWRLTPERLELRSGITTRQHRSVPRDRVRSVDLRADPVRRAFGLTVVKVGTGEHAGEGTELVLDSLDRHEAEPLRRTLLGQEETGRPDGRLAELRWSWIRYAPLSVWTFTGAAVVLGALYKALDSFGLKKFTARLATAAWEWLIAQPLLTIPLLLGVNLAVGALGAVLLFAESWGRYRLDREPGRLRIRRGLLTSRSLTLEERRLRGVEISEPLLLRLGGGARIRTIATGLGKARDDESEDASTLTPPLPRAQALRIAAEITGTRVPPLVPHPAAARRRRIVRAVVTAAVIAILVAGLKVAAPEVVGPDVAGLKVAGFEVAGFEVAGVVPWAGGWVWLLPVAALAYGLWLALASAASLGHALGSCHLVARRGAVARRTIVLERRGIAGWTITESYFQRRSGLLTVSATTAAGRGRYEVVDVGRGDGLDLAERAVPELLTPFLTRGKR